MPLYLFTCSCGHTTEKRTGYGEPFAPCALCGLPAKRESIYRDQYIFGETTPKGRAAVPRDEKRYDKQFKEFQEASAEINHTVTKLEKEHGVKLKTPNYYKMGVAKAKRIKAGKEAPLG